MLQESQLEQQERRITPLSPIGVFDSGVGGLTVLKDLLQLLPDEDYIYVGDTANIPYGNRPPEEIIDLSLRKIAFLVEQGVKLVIVACNTASQAALHVMRERYPELPFIGVVPAVKPAAKLTSTGSIAILATNQTSRDSYLQRLIENFAPGLDVIAQGCPELVMLVEQGKLEGPEVEAVLQPTISRLAEKNVDVIVLGCTHFPALRPAIERLIAPGVQVIDSGAAIARRAQSMLTQSQLLHPEQGQRSRTFWCSGDPEIMSSVASAILGFPIRAQQIRGKEGNECLTQ